MKLTAGFVSACVDENFNNQAIDEVETSGAKDTTHTKISFKMVFQILFKFSSD